MNGLVKLSMLLVTMGTLVLFQACSKAPETSNEANKAPAQEDAQVAERANDSGFVEVRDKKFKLAPDIPKDGSETHMDFYVQDQKGKHVPGAQIVLHLTKPSGEKDTFNLTNDEGGEHYHAKTQLTETGDYQAVAQVTVDGKKYNPRFSFTYNP
jgi:hypothetical protein